MEGVVHNLDRMLPQLLSLVVVPEISRFPNILACRASSPRAWISRNVVYGVPHVFPTFYPRYRERSNEWEKDGSGGTNEPGWRGGEKRSPHGSWTSVDKFEVGCLLREGLEEKRLTRSSVTSNERYELTSNIKSLYVGVISAALCTEYPFFSAKSSKSMAPPFPALITLITAPFSPASLAFFSAGNKSCRNFHLA